MNAHVLYTGISIFDKLTWRTIAPKNFLFGNCTVNYDYILTNSIKSLLISSKYIPNATHTNYFLNITNNMNLWNFKMWRASSQT